MVKGVEWYQEMRGEGLKGMTELECQKRKGLQRLVQFFSDRDDLISEGNVGE